MGISFVSVNFPYKMAASSVFSELLLCLPGLRRIRSPSPLCQRDRSGVAFSVSRRREGPGSSTQEKEVRSLGRTSAFHQLLLRARWWDGHIRSPAARRPNVDAGAGIWEDGPVRGVVSDPYPCLGSHQANSPWRRRLGAAGLSDTCPVFIEHPTLRALAQP